MKMLLIKIGTLFLLVGAAVAKKNIARVTEYECNVRYLGECLTVERCSRDIGEPISNQYCGNPKLNGGYTCCPIYYGWAKCNDTSALYCEVLHHCYDYLGFGQQNCPKTQKCCAKIH